MIKTADLFKEKKFPKWFKDHSIFEKVDRINKIFPKIGLPNFEEEIQIENGGPIKETAKELIKVIGYHIEDRSATLKQYIESKPDMKEARKNNGIKCIEMLNKIQALMNNKPAFLKEKNGKITINLPRDITLDGDKCALFKGGQSFFRVFNRLNEILSKNRFSTMICLEELEQFKKFSSENIPNSKFKVVFSSDGSDGAWDIATMSMRGVKSCQSWDGEYRHCTIGSVIDPFVGIIYLTSGAKSGDYGSKMNRRCLVRFVVNSKTNKPYILLDNMYPSLDDSVLDLFKKSISSRTNMEVEYAPNSKVIKHTYIPLNETRSKLKNTSCDEDNDAEGLYSIQSYQDIKIQDKVSNKNDGQQALFEKNVRIKMKKLTSGLAKQFSSSLKELVEDEKVPEDIAKIAKILSRYPYEYNFHRSMVNVFAKNLKKDDFNNSNLFMKRVIYSYFNNKKEILSLKNKFATTINTDFVLTKNNKLTPEKFVVMMNYIYPKIDQFMKDKLKEFNDKKKPTKILPLP